MNEDIVRTATINKIADIRRNSNMLKIKTLGSS